MNYNFVSFPNSEKHEGRPLLVVAGGWTDGERTSEFWDFTKPGAKWELTSKSILKAQL